jgi:hypothetical protein
VDLDQRVAQVLGLAIVKHIIEAHKEKSTWKANLVLDPVFVYARKKQKDKVII